MSLLVGCVDRTNRRRESVVARQMIASLARRRYVRSAITVRSPAAFGNSVNDQRRSVELSHSEYLVVADLRLDNRSELEMSLGCPPEVPEVELLVRGFERWGEQLPDRLCGDFAFAIWNSRHRELYAARDPFGIKTLYYHVTAELILISNDVEPLVAHINREAFDGRMVADYLLTSFRHQRRTFYRDVARLQPGHFLKVSDRECRQRRYFFPPREQVHLGGTQSYSEEFRRLLTISIRDRLKSDYPIVVHLSGGIDSTSIAILARELYACDPVGRPSLSTASAIFPGLPCDESAIIAATNRRLPFPSNYWCGYDAKFENIRNPVVAWPGSPAAISGGSTGDLAIAERLGAKVIVSGTGGDEVAYTGGIFRDLAASGRWWTLVKETIGSKRFDHRRRWRYLADAMVGLTPAVVRGVRQRIRRRRRTAPPAWLGPDLLQEWSLSERQGDQSDDVTDSISSWTQRDVWNALMTVTTGVPIDYRQHYGAEAGIDMRFPFLDRRLVTFVLSIGYEHRLPGGFMRRLQWEALRAEIPEEVFARPRVMSAESARIKEGRNAAPLYADILEASNWRSGYYVDQLAARALFRRTVHASASGQDSHRDWQVLQRIATFEVWLRAVRSYTVIPSLEAHS